MSYSIHDVVQFDGCLGQLDFVKENRFATSRNDSQIIFDKRLRSFMVASRIMNSSRVFTGIPDDVMENRPVHPMEN